MLDPDLPNLIAGASGVAVGKHDAEWLRALASPAVHVAHMDRLGIGSHVVGYSNATQGISWGDAREDLANYRRTNDLIARDWVAAYLRTPS